MKRITPPIFICVMITLLSTCIFNKNLHSQTIVIDSTFTSDAILHPFGPSDTLYSLKISGSVQLNTDTSLVRVVVGNEDSLEYMVFEYYPMIADSSYYSFSGECDETAYLNGFIPEYLKIFICEATLQLGSISDSATWQENLDSLQYSSKQNKDLEKIDNMNAYINERGWKWFAYITPKVEEYYYQKKNSFGVGYNLLGIDYYTGGIYNSIIIEQIPPTDGTTDLISQFDWRRKHDADLEGSLYWDGDLDYYGNIQETGNGWMTGILYQRCESCAAYGTIGAFEAYINLYYNFHADSTNSLRLSERDAFNCSKYYGTYVGCKCLKGKMIYTILDYIEDNGVVEDTCFEATEDTTGYCEGNPPIPDCSYTSKCPDPAYLVKLENRIPFNYNSTQGLSKDEFIKRKLLEHGPLIIEVGHLFEMETTHCVPLVGFAQDEAGNTLWIMKNSWGFSNVTPPQPPPVWPPIYNHKGYVTTRLNLSTHATLPYLYHTFYALSKPLMVDKPDNQDLNAGYFIHTYDKDNDGYWNWGFDMPDEWEPPCNSLADWNDNRNRIGPRDDYYYGISVEPQMEVKWGFINPRVLENHGIYEFTENDLNANNELFFVIANPGTAQLNLSYNPFGGIFPVTELSDEDECFELDITETDLEICNQTGNNQTTFKITFDSECQGNPECPKTASYMVDVHVDDEDVIEDFEFALVYYNCTKIPGVYEIEEFDTWDGYRVINQDVKVLTGVTLQITGKVAMAPGAKIIVEGGAELIIDGGTITGVCDEFWKGIDVWGDDEYSQFDGRQGKVKLLNGGTISHALCAVETGIEAVGYYIPTGGIVQSYGGVFKDNIIGVRFYPYQNFNPQTSEPANNLSRFKNTGFITTEFLYGMEIEPGESAIPETFVDLQSVEGILFKGNTFKNLATTNNESRGMGIRSSTAGFYVYNECAVPNTTPCPEYYISRFEHLDYGIMVLDDRESLPIVIDSATFTDNKRGILMSGVNNAEIFHNTFEMDMPDSYHSTSDTLIGVYLEACQEFLLTENYFTGYSGTQMEHAAIYAHNLGPYYNEIYNNYIENLSCGIIAAGENRDEEDNDVGLCIKCNDFTDCQYDVYVTPYGGINPDRFGIAETQGHSGSAAPPGVDPNTMAAGNTFTDPDFSDLEYQFFNNANLDIVTYYHHPNITNIFLEPEENNNIDPSRDDQVEYSKSVSCPSILNENITPLTEYNYIESESVTIELYQDTLDTYVDGGSTSDLNFEVQTSFPDEALQIRQDLLDDSPYLSDTVMNSAIYKENVLPNAMIRDILVSNPQSAKSANVLNTLNSRFDPMPDYMMAEIMNGLNVYGHKEVLEKNKGRHINNRQKTFSKLVRFYKKDTINSWSNDSLIGLFNKENNPEALYRSSLFQLYLDDSLSTCNTLASIPVIFTLNTNEQDEYQSFSDLFSIISELKYNGYVLDSNQKSTLEDLSQNNNDFIGIYARNILINHGLKKYNEQIFLPDNLKSSTTWELPEESGLKNPSVLKVFPNPGKNYFILEYDIREFVGVPTVKITDITGKPFAFIRLSYKQNQMVQATNDWPAGIYLIQLAIDNSIIESCKLSIIK